MSIESRSRQYGKVFDHWQIKEYLGSGSGGKTAVFRLVRSDSTRGVSALKVVNLIEVRGDINSLSEFRRKEYETARDECSRNAEQEVWLMDDLRGNTNIVDYLDHTFVDWSDDTGFGRDLLIRMELLKDLRSELQNGRAFSEREVLKIGSDICIALIRCHRKNILHRDIKPENIFRNKDGDYKLGDFGVSRVLDACPGAVASTGIGTYEYWPAEQMTGRYDKRVDIYSLGLVLYELCNQNRLPFAASTYVTGKEVSLRLAGTPLPEPIEASPTLSEVILKACAFDLEERYQSAEELLRALNHVIRSLQKTAERRDAVKTTSAVQKKTEYATLPAEDSEVETPRSKYKTISASADEQKTRTSFFTEPAKKVYETEPAEKHVPRYVTQHPRYKKRPVPVLWIAVALLGLCIAIFGAGVLFMRGSDEQNPDGKETILQRESTPETAVQSTTSPVETILTTDDYETTTVDTAEIETVLQTTEAAATEPVFLQTLCVRTGYNIKQYGATSDTFQMKMDYDENGYLIIQENSTGFKRYFFYNETSLMDRMSRVSNAVTISEDERAAEKEAILKAFLDRAQCADTGDVTFTLICTDNEGYVTRVGDVERSQINGKVYVSVRSLVYDQKMNVIQEVVYTDGKISKNVEFEYNSANQVIREKIKNFSSDSSGTSFNYDIEYVYDGLNRLKKEISTCVSDDSLSSSRVYRYSDDGTSYTVEYHSNNGVSHTNVYYNDAQGKIVKEITYENGKITSERQNTFANISIPSKRTKQLCNTYKETPLLEYYLVSDDNGITNTVSEETDGTDTQATSQNGNLMNSQQDTDIVENAPSATVNNEITTEQSGYPSAGKGSQYDVKNSNIDGKLTATVINTDSLKVRSTGAIYGEQIGVLTGGTTVAVWEANGEGWYKIDSNQNGQYDYGGDGWCSGEYLYIR